MKVMDDNHAEKKKPLIPTSRTNTLWPMPIVVQFPSLIGSFPAHQALHETAILLAATGQRFPIVQNYLIIFDRNAMPHVHNVAPMNAEEPPSR